MEDPIFYTLPATDIEAGMSTEDGQDIVDVDVDDGWVLYHTVTPGHEDETDARMSDGRVHLAVFKDTRVDGSHHLAAIITTAPHERKFDLRTDPILDKVTRFTADEFADALTWWFEFDGDPGHWGGALAEVERRGATLTVATNAGQRFTIQVQETPEGERS